MENQHHDNSWWLAPENKEMVDALRAATEKYHLAIYGFNKDEITRQEFDRAFEEYMTIWRPTLQARWAPTEKQKPQVFAWGFCSPG
jgi:hypothetical protein